MGGWASAGALALCLWSALASSAAAQPAADGETNGGLLEIVFVPTERAQLAIWVQDAGGELLSTVRLTEAVAYRGIGNRPGASQMNSGFRWPYGRREGALPVWARKRAQAPGAEPFRTGVFQDRGSEGFASRTSPDQSGDDYYCLAFDRSRSAQDALDAVACASVILFSSDKGRFITEADVEAGYGEPYRDLVTGEGRPRPLPLHSLYPPRRDVDRCTGDCFDHEDVDLFAEHAREVMPEIDAVTMATPVGGLEQRLLHPVPVEWAPGDYRLCVEANVEGDYNATFDDEAYPTPTEPIDRWDFWATTYGYPYRGQPSVVYCVDMVLRDEQERVFETTDALGTAGTWDQESTEYGTLRPMDGMTDDPVEAPGSGADRLHQMDGGERVRVIVHPSFSCADDAPPSAVTELRVERHHQKRNAHQWAELSFEAAGDDRGIFRYDVRVSTEPITDDAGFMAAEPAKEATIEAAELRVPTDAAAGETIHVELGGLVAQTHYHVAVRAMDRCAGLGPIATGEVTTTERVFATVSPCFVATAAWGTPLAAEVGSLRRLRDRHLMVHPAGRQLVGLYHRLGPELAAWAREHEALRAAARMALTPVVALARWLDG